MRPAAFLLPVAGILLVTSEWSQRTGMITFTLVPRRSRVLGTKLIASLILALAMLVMSVTVAAAAVLVASPGVDGTWTHLAPLIAQSALYLTTGMVIGVAFGAILLASTPAIVVLFTLRSRGRRWRHCPTSTKLPRGWTPAAPSTRCPTRS